MDLLTFSYFPAFPLISPAIALLDISLIFSYSSIPATAVPARPPEPLLVFSSSSTSITLVLLAAPALILLTFLSLQN